MRHTHFVLCVALIAAGSMPASAQNTILKCPVAQPPARNGDKPDPELLKKLIRCRKGEKSVEPGSEGAVAVEVTALTVGAPRDWDGRRDSGSGGHGTKVYPIKVTYTEKTYYRTRTVMAEDWMRVMNFYVDAFGEWRSGSEESLQSPSNRSIPK